MIILPAGTEKTWGEASTPLEWLRLSNKLISWHLLSYIALDHYWRLRDDMSGQTTYLITFDQLNKLAALACYLDDREVIPFDSARKHTVNDIHDLVEKIAGPDASLIYPDPEAA